MVVDLSEGSLVWGPENLTVFGGEIFFETYFAADDITLWKVDAAGNVSG